MSQRRGSLKALSRHAMEHQERVLGRALPTFSVRLSKADRGDLECIYLIQCSTTLLVKIGTTWHVPKRALAIQASCPTPLMLLAVGRGGTAQEAVLHRWYEQWRHHGEWFGIPAEEIGRLATILNRGLLALFVAAVDAGFQEGISREQMAAQLDPLTSLLASSNPPPVPSTSAAPTPPTHPRT